MRKDSWLRPWMIGLGALLLLAGIGAAAVGIKSTFIDTGLVASLTINGDVLPSAPGVKQLGNSSLYWWQVNSTAYYVPGGGVYDTMAGANAGTMYLGPTNATGIVEGKPGAMTTFPGNVTVTGTLQGSAGTGTATGLVPITLYENTTVTNSVTSGETAGSTYSLPANTLSAVGQKLRVSAGWTKAANANSVSYKLYFNSTAWVFATSTGSADTIFTDFEIVRTTAGYSWHNFTASAAGVTGGHGTSTATFTGAIDIHISVIGATTNGDLSTNYMRVEWWP